MAPCAATGAMSMRNQLGEWATQKKDEDARCIFAQVRHLVHED
jgi:hypothetical protein